MTGGAPPLPASEMRPFLNALAGWPWLTGNSEVTVATGDYTNYEIVGLLAIYRQSATHRLIITELRRIIGAPWRTPDGA